MAKGTLATHPIRRLAVAAMAGAGAIAPPLKACMKTCASSTQLASTPGSSSVGANGNTPASETRPCVGLKPTRPHSAEGTRTEPPVSVPSATGTMPAATAAALPALEPPVIWEVRHGLRAAPCTLRSPVGP
ncbi:hypothetical protein G6F24_017026 [Rhizopus arrhizus]|nr:hypothetical protein G6F24_017026 [Rhizopus arrhizus]